MTEGGMDWLRPVRIKRTCLSCDEKFLARGRFNRICPSCRKLNRDVDSEWFGMKSHLRPHVEDLMD